MWRIFGQPVCKIQSQYIEYSLSYTLQIYMHGTNKTKTILWLSMYDENCSVEQKKKCVLKMFDYRMIDEIMQYNRNKSEMNTNTCLNSPWRRMPNVNGRPGWSGSWECALDLQYLHKFINKINFLTLFDVMGMRYANIWMHRY